MASSCRQSALGDGARVNLTGRQAWRIRHIRSNVFFAVRSMLFSDDPFVAEARFSCDMVGRNAHFPVVGLSGFS
jgi:hypothetical protein